MKSWHRFKGYLHLIISLINLSSLCLLFFILAIKKILRAQVKKFHKTSLETIVNFWLAADKLSLLSHNLPPISYWLVLRIDPHPFIGQSSLARSFDVNVVDVRLVKEVLCTQGLNGDWLKSNSVLGAGSIYPGCDLLFFVAIFGFLSSRCRLSSGFRHSSPISDSHLSSGFTDLSSYS